MTREEAIEILERKTTIPDTNYTWAQIDQAIDMAISALRSTPQPGNPLTLDQLREMDGQPVWVVCLKKEKYIDPPIGWRILEKSISGSFGVWNGENCLSQRSYSSDWFAYSYPPAHIDRGEWTAEWIYPENEWNLPRCSKCGCNSKDATYGHKDRFCPKCGRAMTEEAWAELEQRLQRAPLPEPPEER